MTASSSRGRRQRPFLGMEPRGAPGTRGTPRVGQVTPSPLVGLRPHHATFRRVRSDTSTSSVVTGLVRALTCLPARLASLGSASTPRAPASQFDAGGPPPRRGRWMLAKYSGRCAICPKPIRPGDSIASLGEDSSTWMHAACHPSIEVVAAALAEAPPAVRPAGQPRKRKPRRTPKAPMIAPAGAGSVYTDGACSGNPGPGGWAWAIDRDTWASGSEPASTNQRMEIRAALEAGP